MLIHAHRRKAKFTVDLFGQVIEFAPNEAGDVVAEVTDPSCIERLLAIAEGYRAHSQAEDEPVKTPETVNKPATGPFVLTKGAESLDLATLGDEALKAFAKDNGITLHHKAKGDTIRKAIVDALKGAE